MTGGAVPCGGVGDANGAPARVLMLHAATWRTGDDVYAALLGALGAPAWHGRNLDALHDSLTADDVNKVGAPLRVEVRGLAAAGAHAQDTATGVAEVFADLASEGHAVAWHVADLESNAPAA